MMRRLMSLIQEQREVNNLRMFIVRSDEIFCPMHSSFNQQIFFFFEYLLCARHFPNQKYLQRLSLFPRSIMTLLKARYRWPLLSGHPPVFPLLTCMGLYMCEFHEQMTTIAYNTFKHDKTIGFCFLFLLLTPRDICISIRDGLLLSTYLHFCGA